MAASDDERHKELQRIFEEYIRPAIKEAQKTQQCPSCFYSMLAALAINGLMLTTKGDVIAFAAKVQQAIDLGTNPEITEEMPSKLH